MMQTKSDPVRLMAGCVEDFCKLPGVPMLPGHASLGFHLTDKIVSVAVAPGCSTQGSKYVISFLHSLRNSARTH